MFCDLAVAIREDVDLHIYSVSGSVQAASLEVVVSAFQNLSRFGQIVDAQRSGEQDVFLKVGHPYQVISRLAVTQRHRSGEGKQADRRTQTSEYIVIPDSIPVFVFRHVLALELDIIDFLEYHVSLVGVQLVPVEPELIPLLKIEIKQQPLVVPVRCVALRESDRAVGHHVDSILVQYIL